MKYSMTVAVLALALLSGCAGVPRVQAPVTAEAKAKGVSAVHSAVLDDTDHMRVHLDDAREVYYVQSFGNSVAVGVMLGPLGVLANVAATRAVTEGDLGKLKGKLSVAPSQIFNEVAQESGLQLNAARAEGGVNLSPHLYLVKLSDGKVLLASALLVEAPSSEAQMAQVRYLYQLPLRYTIDELAQAKPSTSEEISRQMRVGFAELIRFYQNDKPGAMEKERLVRYKSDFLSPRFDFEAPGRVVSQNGPRIWIRHTAGIAAVQRGNITILGPWE